MPNRAGTTKYHWWDCKYALSKSLSLMKSREGQCVFAILHCPPPWSMVFHLLEASLHQKSYDVDMLGFSMLLCTSHRLQYSCHHSLTPKQDSVTWWSSHLFQVPWQPPCSLVLDVSILQHTWFQWIGQTSADDELIIWISCVGAGKRLKHTGQGDPKNRTALIHVHHFLSCGKFQVELVTLTRARFASDISSGHVCEPPGPWHWNTPTESSADWLFVACVLTSQ